MIPGPVRPSCFSSSSGSSPKFKPGNVCQVPIQSALEQLLDCELGQRLDLHCRGSLSHEAFALQLLETHFVESQWELLSYLIVCSGIQTFLTLLRQLAQDHIRFTLPGIICRSLLVQLQTGQLIRLLSKEIMAAHPLESASCSAVDACCAAVSLEECRLGKVLPQSGCCHHDDLPSCLHAWRIVDRWLHDSWGIDTCRLCTLRESASWLA